LSVPRVLGELRLIDRLQLWAATERVVGGSERGVDLRERSGGIRVDALEEVRNTLLSRLVRKAGEVVALEESFAVVHAASEVRNVNAGEGVDFAGVAAYGEELRVLESGGSEIGLEERDGVLVTDRTLVPVVRNLLVSRSLRSSQHEVQKYLETDRRRTYTSASSEPVMEKKDLRTDLERRPSGYSADLLAMKRYMKVYAAGCTATPVNGPLKK